ncbi:MAG: nuclease A inhibitor family protein [Coleofasciculaceae cyanobacterium]
MSKLTKSELQELQAYRFNRRRKLGFSDDDCYIYTLLGKTQDNEWICLASTVPKQAELEEQEISRSFDAEFSASQFSGEHTNSIVARIEEILTELPPLKTYGVYNVGYNYTYQHQLVCKAASTRELAFEKAADLVEIGQFKGFYPDEDYFREEIHYDYQDEEEEMELDEFYLRYQKLNQFLTQNLTNILVYRLSFWDWDYIYIFGQTQAGDWLGVETTNEFVYNP